MFRKLYRHLLILYMWPWCFGMTLDPITRLSGNAIRFLRVLVLCYGRWDIEKSRLSPARKRVTGTNLNPYAATL